MAGFQHSNSGWSAEYEQAKLTASEVLSLLQERGNDKTEASRRTTAARRKIAVLGTTIDSLLSTLDEPGVSEAAKNRRRDQCYELQTRRESMQAMLKRNASTGSQAGPQER